MKLIKISLCTALLASLLSSSIMADCSYELFSISSTKNTKIIDFVEQLSDECGFSIIVTDPKAQEFLETKLNKTNLNNLTIDEVLNIVLKENNLSYTIENNILKISYLTTKLFSIDYILSQRKSTGATDVTLSSEGAGGTTGTTGAGGTTGATAGGNTGTGINRAKSGKSGIKIESVDEVHFWKELDLEFQKILNRPQDMYLAEAPVINKNAGIITVTATSKQIERFEKYLKALQDKVKLEVLIDVQLLSVTLSDGKTTGVDWSQLFALENINVSVDKIFAKNVSEFKDGRITTGTYGGSSDNAHLININAKGTLNEVIKFLKTQGEVNSISNPKVLTLNNQPAIISAGTEFFYKIQSSSTLAGGTTGTTSQEDQVLSVFAGVLLDITPEISDDKTITLKINPSLSETASDMTLVAGAERTMPPDLRRRQLSSVVTVKDGNRIILGGLINTSYTNNVIKVPILGDIPIINSLFKYENKQKVVQELIIVIEPHIINRDKSNLSLESLGYQNFSEKILKSAKEATVSLTSDSNDSKE
ncbi:pilus (MSHA type) biogenesis protein MshL [Sulfurimonas sp.]|uniref:pilus (MSHA type) biogenesis protein MshL n=1 Tax=Sulfurimonas sp. TaxID=2022749 RepID=UPI0025FD9F37|nr:pilus (MSHA type) biogenesis protein MshL [Sulfurimonas sp.]